MSLHFIAGLICNQKTSPTNSMNCHRCGKPITAQTFKIYRNRCVPCSKHRLIPRIQKFSRETLTILTVIILLPPIIVFELVRRSWCMVAPLPFRRNEIIRMLSSHFGTTGAIEYVNGLRYGYHEGLRKRPCCSGIHSDQPVLSICFTIGRDDGGRLRRDPKQLRRILDQRCSAPYKRKSRKRALPRNKKSPRRELRLLHLIHN